MDSKVFRERQSRAWSEAEFQGIVLDLARRLGWKHYHTHDSRRSPAGFPNLALRHDRLKRILFRELKTAKGRVSESQKEWIEGLKVCGADVGVWRPADLLDGTILNQLSPRTTVEKIIAAD